MTADEQTTGPVWRDRGTIIANQQARIAELEAEVRELRLKHGPALFEEAMTAILSRTEAAEADAAGLRARIEAALSNHPRICDVHGEGEPITCGWKRAVADVERALPAEPTPAAECGVEHPTNPTVVPCVRDKGHEGSHMSTTGCGGSVMRWSPTPAAEPHAEDGAGEPYYTCGHSYREPGCGWPCCGFPDRPAPVADPDDTKDGQR